MAPAHPRNMNQTVKALQNTHIFNSNSESPMCLINISDIPC